MSNSLDQKNIEEIQSFAEEIIVKAGEILVSHKKNNSIKSRKDALELHIATDADYDVEKYLVQAIRKKYPGHFIFSEEATHDTEQGSNYTWIIDPLDGTKEYVRNSPYYYTLIAIEYDGKLVASASFQPEVKRLFSGNYQNGAYLNKKRIHPSSENNLKKSLVSISLPMNKLPEIKTNKYTSFISNLTYQSYRLRNTPWDVEALFNVAMGIVEAYVSPGGPKWWDIAPGIQLVEAVGGIVTDLKGNSLTNRDVTPGILACNNTSIQKQLLHLLNTYYFV